MSTTVGGQVIPNPRMVAIRAVFSALFDAVDTIDSWDEGRWEDLIAAFNATGRLVFGWPRLESSESDIFGALDDIAAQLEGTKTAMELTAKDTRVVLHQLHEALDPMLPDEPTEPEPDPPLLKEPDRESVAEPCGACGHDLAHIAGGCPVPGCECGSEPVGLGDYEGLANDSETPAVHSLEDPTNDSLGPKSRRQGPRYDVPAMFAVLRRHMTIADAARELGLTSPALLGRLDTLEGHGELPDDIKAMRHRIHPAAPVKGGSWRDQTRDRPSPW